MPLTCTLKREGDRGGEGERKTGGKRREGDRRGEREGDRGG